jgi:nitrite reductase/ring-hydroxylating ferredoxin subunit
MKVPLCQLEEIPEEGAKTVDFLGREVLVYKDQGRPKAVLNVCMHLGGPMQLEGNRLVCQWHGAAFDCKRGRYVEGPARPDARLITLPTRIENGTLSYVYGE